MNVNGFGTYLSSTVATKYYNERRSPDSTVAQKVFHIPELLEAYSTSLPSVRHVVD
jgi:hypothetical protein